MGHIYSIAIVILLILWGVYRRIRRTIGFQKLIPRKLITRMVILCVVGILLLVAAARHPLSYPFDLLGLFVGAVLAYYSIRTTVIERRGTAWFYKPNLWIGIVLLAAFFLRLGYRMYADYSIFGQINSTGQGGQNMNPYATYAKDPWTSSVFFAFLGYYMVYHVYLLRKEKTLEHTQVVEGGDVE